MDAPVSAFVGIFSDQENWLAGFDCGLAHRKLVEPPDGTHAQGGRRVGYRPDGRRMVDRARGMSVHRHSRPPRQKLVPMTNSECIMGDCIPGSPCLGKSENRIAAKMLSMPESELSEVNRPESIFNHSPKRAVGDLARRYSLWPKCGGDASIEGFQQEAGALVLSVAYYIEQMGDHMRIYLRGARLVATILLVPMLLPATRGHALARDSAPSFSPARLTGPIDASSLITLKGNTHPLAQARFDRGPAPLSMPAKRLLLVLQRSTRQEADLQTYLQSVQDSNSPRYRKFLSPEEFGQRFGVADADLQATQAWLTREGFSVSRVSKSRMAIEFAGTVGQVQTAFHTSIHRYVIGGNEFWANVTDPQIPSALSPVVAGLASLNSFKPKAQYIRGPSGVYDAKTHTITPTYTIGDSTDGYYIFLGPADAATIYDTPTALNPNLSGTAYDGTGVTIGIAGDSNIDVTQNANYRATFSLAAKATTVVVDGNDPGKNGDAVEAYLDTQVSGGIAPNANVILYTAANTELESGLFLAIARALDDNQADILNVSFSGCEAAQGTAGNQYILDLWEQAAAQGISVTVSSGDSGSAGCDNPDTEDLASQGLAVNGLGSTPYNISVGGTDFDALYSNFPASFSNYVDLTNTLPSHRSALKYIPEEPWNNSTIPNTSILDNAPISVASHGASDDNIVAAGGGLSTLYSAPNWQGGFGVATARSMPDVSFLAGNGFYGALWGICTDLEVDSSGKPVTDCAAGASGSSFNLTGVGGTSASSPAFAGMLALVEQETGARLGQANYALYQLARTNYSSVFHDVVTGDNSVECMSGTPNCEAATEVGAYYLSGYNAGNGYDEASGLGSVDAAEMTKNWASVNFSPTTSTLQLNGASAPLNITHGQTVSVSATVSSTAGTPAGEIGLVDNLSPANRPNLEGIADFTVSGGSASGSTTSLPGGSYNVSAHYAGSSAFAESDSNAIPVMVAAESSTTTIKVAGYFDPATGKAATTPYYGYIFLLDAQPYGNSASAANPNGAATGTITFKTGAATLGTAAIASDGIAELQTADLPGGNLSLTAAFPGDASFLGSTSASYPFTVVPAVTTLEAGPTYTSSPTPILAYLTTDSVGVAPTGTVTLMNGSTAVVSAPLVGTASTATTDASGTVTFQTANLPAGNYNFTVVYGGDANYAGSTAPSTIPVTVFRANTPVILTPSASTVLTNQPLQVTVTPTRVTGLPLPTGTVTMHAYSDSGAITSPPTSLKNGTVTFSYSANTLAPGSDSFYASYSGDADYAPNSGTATVTVNPSGTIKPTVVVTGPSVTTNPPVSITVAVSGPSGDPVPTGFVSIAVGAPAYQFVSVEALTNGSVTISTQNQVLDGPIPVTATYMGDSNYTGGSASTTVNTFELPQVAFTLSPTDPVASQPLNVTVTLSGSTIYGPPTGKITLSNKTTYTSSATQLTAGSATFAIPANTLAVGNDTLYAAYSGDSNYKSATWPESIAVSAIPPTFSVTGTAIIIAPGGIIGNASTITITPAGGFTGSVALTASVTSSPAGAQYPPTLSFGATSPVSIAGTAPGTATLTITTTAATITSLAYPKRPVAPWYAASGAALACLLLFGLPARRRKWRNLLGMIMLLVVLTASVMACGAGSSGGGGGGGGIAGTTDGNYTITITGTSGALTETGTVTLAVQ